MNDPTKKLSPARRSAISPFLVMDVMEEAARAERAGRRVLHLEVGQPGTSAPRRVLAAAHRALDSHELGYSVARGRPELRQRIARHYASTHHVDIESDRIFVTAGASGAFVLAFLAAFDTGQRVAIATPGYPCYRNILEALGLIPVQIRVEASTGYQLTATAIEQLEPAPDGVVIASPANPTGSGIVADELRRIAEVCRCRGITILSDEIYHGLTYDDFDAASLARIDDSALVVNSFSKYFSMTGWRLGWLAVPPVLTRALEALSQNLFICAPTLAQLAAIEAFDAAEELESHRRRYAENRQLLLTTLERCGIENLAPPHGAFYLYADVSRWTNDSVSFCHRILADTDVAVTPGVDFDPERGNQFIRLSFCTKTEDVREAASRLETFLSRQRLRHV